PRRREAGCHCRPAPRRRASGQPRARRPPSGNWKLRRGPVLAVNECGVSCQIHVLNLAQGDQKKPDYLKINPTARIPTLIDPDGPGGKPLTLIQSWAILMYLCEKAGKFLPADPVGRARMFQWLAEGAADYAPTNQNIFFLGTRMPEKVPDSAIKFYEDRFVNLWRFAEE